MNEDINLIPNKKRDVVLQAKLVYRIRIFSTAILIFIALMSMLLFVVRLNSPLTSLKKEEAVLLSNISLLHEKTARLLLLKNRLKEISEIRSKRISLDQTISKVTAIIPSEMTIDLLSVDKTTVAITASSGSLATINQFLDSLVESVTTQKVFKKITLQNLSLDNKSRKYIISVKLELI